MSIEVPDTLSASDREAVKCMLEKMGTSSPTLEEMWLCMDHVWDRLRCDNRRLDPEKLDSFYSHPVWLLNGLFIEQHSESISNRELISNWIVQTGAARIADFGGGFGTLARMIASKCPHAQIEVIEPYPHPVAVVKSRDFANLSFRKELAGTYDLIVAMDVLEHVPHPLQLVSKTAYYLKIGGIYFTANCFYPVIKCHLPSTFHFRNSWKLAMSAINLRHVGDVSYGSAFEKTGASSIRRARLIEARSRLSFALLELRSKLKLRSRLRSFLARLH
jgi:2-polyprenyl-3-methyl-5-hydroxy-6-metoxy-1,4-benzoquinol methylase